MSSPDTEFDPDRVVIRDNRKIDPLTGEARKPAGGAPTPPAEPAPEPRNETQTLLDERTADLQRLQAEYANYRKRADRDRLAAGDLAVGRTLAELLPVIDDLDRAKSHGDLTGALKAVSDKLDAALNKLGLVAFGAVGDPFDPSLHEAVLHDESDSVAVPTCTTVMRQGYQHKDRLLRPAMVGVTDPIQGGAPQASEQEPEEPLEGENQQTPAQPQREDGTTARGEADSEETARSEAGPAF